MARLTSARLFIALTTLSVLTASVGSQELDPNRYDPDGFLPSEWEGYSEVLDGVYSPLGEQIYVREGAEITPWMKSARAESGQRRLALVSGVPVAAGARRRNVASD